MCAWTKTIPFYLLRDMETFAISAIVSTLSMILLDDPAMHSLQGACCLQIAEEREKERAEHSKRQQQRRDTYQQKVKFYACVTPIGWQGSSCKIRVPN